MVAPTPILAGLAAANGLLPQFLAGQIPLGATVAAALTVSLAVRERAAAPRLGLAAVAILTVVPAASASWLALILLGGLIRRGGIGLMVLGACQILIGPGMNQFGGLVREGEAALVAQLLAAFGFNSHAQGNIIFTDGRPLVLLAGCSATYLILSAIPVWVALVAWFGSRIRPWSGLSVVVAVLATISWSRLAVSALSPEAGVWLHEPVGRSALDVLHSVIILGAALPFSGRSANA